MSKKIVIIAGEESGDRHAATIVKNLLSHYPDLQITGIGGQHMQDAGVNLVYDLARYGVTGIYEVIRHIFIIKKAFDAIKAHLHASSPDLLILIDYPGFNLRLANYVKQHLNVRVLYYISPQIWAWKANRIKTIQACVDIMAVIFPFEKSMYEKANVPVQFVGHPLVETIPKEIDPLLLRKCYALPTDKKLIAFLPGSRHNEIEKHVPILVQAAKNLLKTEKNIHFVIPIAKSLNPQQVKKYFINNEIPITFISGEAIDIAACSDCIVVASGTASLECALLAKPMCIIYKTSLITYLAATKLIKIKYLGLCNILQNKMIVPELLQYDFNKKELVEMIKNLLNNHEMKHKMINDLTYLKQSLCAEQADLSIQQLVAEELFSRIN